MCSWYGRPILPIPFGSLALASVLVEANGLEGLDDSLTMVEVDEERPKVFARGARWVSLSSVSVSIARL